MCPPPDTCGLSTIPPGPRALRLRMNFDLFNVLNVQGLNTPGAYGIVTLQNSYGGFGIRPRQVQVNARLEW